jgi:predicted permease
MWEQLNRDLLYTVRVLLRNRAFTIVAILSLALGIGANTFLFSILNALVLKPLPVDHPEQLVFVETKQGLPSHSFPVYREIRDRSQTLSGVMGYRIAPMELESYKGAERIWGYLATGNYFDVLGVRPAVGRFFRQDDDLHPGASPYAVLSYGCWQGRFGGDPQIAGKTVRVNRQSFTILGVAPPDFHGTELFYWPEIWVPMMMQAQIEPGNPWLENRSKINTWIIGRLKPGISSAQSREDLNAIALDLAHQYPATDEGLQFRLGRPGLVGDALGGPAKAFTLGILVLAGLVLLTACANLASLLTAHGAERQREMAIRLSVGATRWRIVRQVLTETVILSLLGGAAGYALAMVLAQSLSNWHAPTDFPVQLNVNPDLKVFLFAGVISLLAGVFFGSIPAGHASRTDAHAVLKGEQMGWRGGRFALRDMLVVIQVALCFVLVSACLLALRGLQQSVNMSLGFQPQEVVVAGFDLGLAGYTEDQGRNFQRHLLEVVEQLPGVRSSAYSNSVPLSIDQSKSTIYPEGAPVVKVSELHRSIVYWTSPQFLPTMGIRLLSGRAITWQDDRNSPLVAVVNKTFGKEILHDENPLGKRFRYSQTGPPIEVVGIVEDGKYERLTESAQPVIFQSGLQSYVPTTTLIVKSSLPESQMIQQIRLTMAQLDPHLPLYGTGSLKQMLGFAFFPSRLAAVALSAFGLLAIMLAATGIHGVVSYSVARRIREIGIRIAVGAGRHQILRLVLGRIAVLLLVGTIIGLVLALAAGQVLASIVYSASPRDPQMLVAVWVAIAIIGLLACWGPTRRALHIDPMNALRTD